MYKGKTVIDVHGHLSTPPQFRAFALNLIVIRDPNERLALTDEAMQPAIDRHLRLLDERGIDVQLISPRPVAMLHWERAPVVEQWTRATNDVIAQQCKMHPKRFVGIGQLPQTPDGNVQRCVHELDRCVHELGFVGAILNPDPGGDRQAPGLNAEHWFPLYERAEALEATLIVHPSVTRDPRLDGIYNAYQYNNLTEETLATILLEQGNVFERFPRLRIVVCHCGGAPRRLVEAGSVFDATQRSRDADNVFVDSGEFAGGQFGMQVKRERAQKLDLSGNLFFDTCAYDPHFLATSLKQRGVERMVFGTEVPGSGSHLRNPETGKPADDVLALLDRFDFISDEDRYRIIYDNPRRVFPKLCEKTL
ncbi:MAG: amidohydrolase family protein [Steroidobacteraceae bacterium]